MQSQDARVATTKSQTSSSFALCQKCDCLHQFLEFFFSIPCSTPSLPSIGPVCSPRILAIRGYTSTFSKDADRDARANVRPSRKENRFHAGHLPRIVSVPASGRHPRAAVRIGIVRHDRIRARRHDDRIAFARIRIKVQIRRHLGAPVHLERVARTHAAIGRPSPHPLPTSHRAGDQKFRIATGQPICRESPSRPAMFPCRDRQQQSDRPAIPRPQSRPIVFQSFRRRAGRPRLSPARPDRRCGRHDPYSDSTA